MICKIQKQRVKMTNAEIMALVKLHDIDISDCKDNFICIADKVLVYIKNKLSKEVNDTICIQLTNILNDVEEYKRKMKNKEQNKSNDLEIV